MPASPTDSRRFYACVIVAMLTVPIGLLHSAIGLEQINAPRSTGHEPSISPPLSPANRVSSFDAQPSGASGRSLRRLPLVRSADDRSSPPIDATVASQPRHAGELEPLPPVTASERDGDAEPSYSNERISTPNGGDLLWWEPLIDRPLLRSPEKQGIDLERVFGSTLQNSAYVRVISELPIIRETSIIEADARFDWTAFIESQWSDLSEPVGSLLQTGRQGRYRDDKLTATTGVRRQNQLGGQWEVGQRIGHESSNSLFINPNNQGTSRLTLNYTQPLLRRAGRSYNTALTVLAKIDTEAARDEVSEKLQAHLVEVAKAYWDLYLRRGDLLQRRRLLERAEEVLAELDLRREIDVSQSQIVRAEAAVESRKVDIYRAQTEIKNMESRLRALVNDPAFGTDMSDELIPKDPPLQSPPQVDLAWSIQTAMQARPEIRRSMREIKAAAVRLNVSKNELLPELNLFLETYASGLRGQSDIGSAIIDQWSVGEPSYTVGINFERPIWNRLARARHNRRYAELRQRESQLKQAMAQLEAEVATAVRELETSHREVDANYRSMQAAEREVEYLYDRWHLLSGSDRSASLMLEDLFAAQERQYAAEFNYIRAQRNYSVAHVQYLRALGTLLQSEGITPARVCDGPVPQLEFYQQNPPHSLKDELDIQSDETPTALPQTNPLPAADASEDLPAATTNKSDSDANQSASLFQRLFNF